MSIVLTELTKRYGDALVVNRVSLEIMDGELFVLLGGSGSGKSTILRMIAGLVPVDFGRIDLNGREVTALAPQLRGTGFVFQNYSIFRHMTVAENIEFGLRIRRAPPAERHQRSEELLDLVGLAGLGSRYSHQLSGGQRQRVALARALAYQPDVLLLDEPFGALDVKIRAQLRESVKQIQRQLQVTTILVTHDQEEAFELADRIGVMDRGHLVEVGAPEDLYHRPRTEYVATFIGGGNVLVGRNERSQIKFGSIFLPFPDGAPPHEDGAPVRVLFRPETVLLQTEQFAFPENTHVLSRGRVVEQVFAGSQRRIRLEVEGLEGTRSLMPRRPYGKRFAYINALQQASGQNEPVNIGEWLWIGLHNYHVLDPTGLKLLICYQPSPGGEAALAYGSQLAVAAKGPVTLLNVIEAGASIADAQGDLEALMTRHFPNTAQANARIRQGEFAEQILLEAQAGFHEMVILSLNRQRSGESSGIGSTARQVLRFADIPVLLVQEPRELIRRILICTAAGEPGKSDIRFGGRLAARTGARATVLHVHRPEALDWELAYANNHLRQAQQSLGALKVASEVKLRAEHAPLEAIVREVETGDYDLIVLGSPAQREPHQARWTDFTSHMVERTTRPVLIVPMQK